MIHTLHLGLSYACNMNCNHCFVSKKQDKLSTTDIKNAIESLYKQGLFIVYYTFGEPLLAKNFVEVCRFVREKGLVQVLMTNGSLINDSMIHTIKELGIQNVFISIDSIIPEQHDANRRYTGAFDKAIKAIRECRNAGVSVGIATTVMSSNISQLDSIYQLGIEEKVNVISFLRQRVEGKLLPLSEDLLTLYHNSIQKWITSKTEIGISIHDPSLTPWLKQLFLNNKISKFDYDKYYEMCSCHSRTTMSIAPDGVISACNLFYYPIGSVFDDSFDCIINRITNGKSFICCPPLSKQNK